MISGIYALKDNLVGFVDVKLIESEDIALRTFNFMCKSSNDFIKFSKNDYALYKIGDFDTITGDIIIHDPVVIIRGDDINDI